MSGHVGDRIRMKRQWRGMTQDDVRRASGISKAYLSELESGKKDTPSGKVLLRIADALGVTVDWLVRDEVTA